MREITWCLVTRSWNCVRTNSVNRCAYSVHQPNKKYQVFYFAD
ncbi:Uncharacterised protein [Serratia fonticola]|nr:Uncharacterised protein [Serratia fonticola]